MTTTSIIIWIASIVLVIALGVLGWWLFASFVQIPILDQSTRNITTQKTPVNSALNEVKKPATPAEDTSSDSAIDKLLISADNQIKNLDLDLATADENLKQ